jgi:hypothetical protein
MAGQTPMEHPVYLEQTLEKVCDVFPRPEETPPGRFQTASAARTMPLPLKRTGSPSKRSALEGSDRPLIGTSGHLLLRRLGALASEEDVAIPNFPRKSEDAALALASRGISASLVRLPPSVHGEGDHGFVPRLIQIGREKGASAYVGDDLNSWPAVHRLDAAQLYRLELEKGTAGTSYHGVADEGAPVREIAEVIGRRLNLPVVSKPLNEAADHFGWIAMFFAIDCPASSTQTREWLGWRPRNVGHLSDLDQAHYFLAESAA